jgi:TPR repeat protein
MAAINLGMLHQNGWGVRLDYAEAYKWYAIAAGRGDNRSRDAMKELAQIMTAAQIVEGRKRAASWVEQHRGRETTLPARGNSGE